jgi:hypothetical protein
MIRQIPYKQSFESPGLVVVPSISAARKSNCQGYENKEGQKEIWDPKRHDEFYSGKPIPFLSKTDQSHVTSL